jgi:hypothetical protein
VTSEPEASEELARNERPRGGYPAEQRVTHPAANVRGAGTLRRSERASSQVKRRMETLTTRPTQAKLVMSDDPP